MARCSHFALSCPVHEVGNPYAPPGIDEPPQVAPHGFELPSEGVAVALRVLLGIAVALLLIGVGSLVMQLELLGRGARGEYISFEEGAINDRRVGLATGGFLLTMLASGVVWCVWQSRISRSVQLRAPGGAPMRFGPHAWGWFFCPVVNLWRPLAVLTEIWESSPLPSSARVGELVRADSPPNWLMAAWWIPWLVASLLLRVASRIMGEQDGIDDLITGSQLQLGAYALYAVAGVFAIVLVTLLQRRVATRCAESQTKGLW